MIRKILIATVALAIGITSFASAADLTEKQVKEFDDAFQKVVAEGYKLFHSPLGTNGVACDMCHPNGADTHAETYPKFQMQIGKVVGLRDMINWCIINPLEGKALEADDPRMIAMDSYIMYERKGLKLAPGKH